ncbi:hypothetical protein NPIL_457481 [Nephila pilipes]|uniref:Uncharacterized protein n=1 Tax=Nephila pilipes TaxID=299642 RepID=A0A8X6QZC7_NEPPI|nr:hypothetical protein NPIL_457481 [Nephila pilipes]
MSRKKVFKTAEEAVEYLFSEELESEMIVLPPEVDEFTIEEGFYDSETLDPSVRDVLCPIIYSIHLLSVRCLFRHVFLFTVSNITSREAEVLPPAFKHRSILDDEVYSGFGFVVGNVQV